MRHLHTLFLYLLLLAVLPSLSQAKTEYFYSSGTCANGNTWYCVTEVVDGYANSFRGVDCAGNTYLRGCSYLPSPANPYGGRAPNLFGMCPNTTTQWQVLVTFDASGYPDQVYGQGCSGDYWIAVISPSKADPDKKPDSSAPNNQSSPKTGRGINQ